MIEMEKTEISSLCCRDLIQVAKVARGIALEIPHPQQLMNRWKGLDCFLFRDEGRIIGMVLVNTGIRYFPNSIAVQSPSMYASTRLMMPSSIFSPEPLISLMPLS